MLSVVEPRGSATLPRERFDTLFRQLYPRLVGLAGRLADDRAEAEDIVQDAFFRLAQAGLDGDDAGSSDPGDAVGLATSGDTRLLDRPDPVVTAWLRRVVLNLGLNRLRERRRAAERQERAARLDGAAEAVTGAGDADGPAGAVLAAEARAEVHAALAALPERQRACLLLRHAGHSYAEIAATVGIAISSVGVYLARAERAFRASYEQASTAHVAAASDPGSPASTSPTPIQPEHHHDRDLS